MNLIGGWEICNEHLFSLAQSAKSILDVGGGRHPAIPVEKLNGSECTLIDISPEELSRAPDGYNKIVGDISTAPLEQKYDLVISRFVAEHIRSGEAFHRNIFRALVPGGIAWHFFPTLYNIPFVANRLFPEQLADWLLGLVVPYRKGWKFPAYYSWCRGPSLRQVKRLENLGYEVLDYTGLYGHPYWDFCPPLASLNRRMARYLLNHPSPLLTSFGMVTLRKPGAA